MGTTEFRPKKRGCKEHEDRNIKIYVLSQRGFNYVEIGKLFGLSDSRVLQVVKMMSRNVRNGYYDIDTLMKTEIDIPDELKEKEAKRMSSNDYDDIYEKYLNIGFSFNYTNKNRLSASKIVFKEELDTISPSKFNNDDVPLLVKCKSCNTYMDFDEYRWICPCCKTWVREITVYTRLEKENDNYLRSINMYKPDCCEMCDGPYPDCISSCRFIED